MDTHQIQKKSIGITEMTPPQTKQELQSFLGAVNYLQTFVPHLIHHTEPCCMHSSKRRTASHGMRTWTQAFIKLNPYCRKHCWNPSDTTWQKQTSHPPVWCFTQGTQSLHHPRQPSHSFCDQVSHRHRDMICQHQEGTVSHHVWVWEVPHLPVWKNIHSWNRPQTAGEDKYEKSHCST